ncbi:hypothetical protein ILYODFUR_009089 [Ilyodon furcidens]|uniref:Uncharacterized protein n=1 Tax=Ilyodon furcidens TaxID=33524 RepID=A0ABV0SJQ2_9TELE
MCPSTELKNSNCQSRIDTKTSLIAVQRLACVLGPDKAVHPPNHIYTPTDSLQGIHVQACLRCPRSRAEWKLSYRITQRLPEA